MYAGHISRSSEPGLVLNVAAKDGSKAAKRIRRTLDNYLSLLQCGKWTLGMTDAVRKFEQGVHQSTNVAAGDNAMSLIPEKWQQADNSGPLESIESARRSRSAAWCCSDPEATMQSESGTACGSDANWVTLIPRSRSACISSWIAQTHGAADETRSAGSTTIDTELS